MACVEKRKCVYRVFVGEPEQKRPLGSQVQMGEHITMNHQEPRCEGRNGIDLAEFRDMWQAVVKTVMNLQVL